MVEIEYGANGLLERSAILADIAELLDGACSGRGGALVVEAAPGLGKTSVVAAAARRGRRMGVAVLEARGGELEQELAWGVARELLATPARTEGHEVPPAARSALGQSEGPGGSDDIAVAHALFQFCTELAERQPLLLIIDDAHWADPASLRWLAYAAPRLGEHTIALLLAARPNDPRRPPELTTLAGRDLVQVRHLPPLSEGAAAQLVRGIVPGIDEALCSACIDTTAGNPFLLTELSRELTNRGGSGAALDATSLTDMSVDRIDRVVARRLLAAGEDATRLAGAAALFGTGGEATAVAAVVDLDSERARRAADALRAADILSSAEISRLVFAHPLLRAAVGRSVPPGHRSELHLRAARWLQSHGESIDRVAAHLLQAEPGGDSWVRDRLVEAGDDAVRSGVAHSALSFYQRAEAERAGPPAADLLVKLARAAIAVDPRVAEHPLTQAMAATPDPRQRVPLALDLALVHQTTRTAGRLLPILDRLVADLEADGAPRGLVLRVQAEYLAQSFFDLPSRKLRRQRLAELSAALTGEAEEEAFIAVQQAVEAANWGTAEDVRQLADKAWASGRLPDLAGSPVTPSAMWVPYFHLYVDDYEWGADVAQDWLRQAQLTGSAVMTVFASSMLTEARWRAGHLRDAIAVAETGWEVAQELGSSFPGWWSMVSGLAQVLVATGAPAEAAELLRRVRMLEGPPPDLMLLPLPRAVRAEVLVANGLLGSTVAMEAGPSATTSPARQGATSISAVQALQQGVTELRYTLEWVDAQEEPSPGAWRFQATLVDGLLALGEVDAAREVATHWLERTRRFGVLSTIGMAERAIALTLAGPEQLDGLVRAEETLSASPARAEHARALFELGAALRRAGQSSAAREPLRRALDQATSCGADRLAQRAREELIAAGARPRRAALTGIDALSPSERRVAQLAAEGLTNRQIAAALFISPKTVERHLAGIYNKLGTSDRGQLPDLIGAASPS